jgi:single-strand DNA-binding protein
MAGSVNMAVLLGHLGADPDLRYTPSGTAVCNLRVATNESWKDKQGQLQSRTEWHRIVIWGKLAETAGEYLAKGRQVHIIGNLRTRQWKDRDNTVRFTTEIHCRELSFIGARGENQRQAADTHTDDVPEAEVNENSDVTDAEVPPDLEAPVTE